MPTRGSRAEAAKIALRRGVELGMTHVDTAEMYQAEELIADAVKGLARASLFLVSKVLPSNASYGGTLSACEASLRRLRTDYLDVYLLHWRGSHPLAETMRALERLVDDGKIRALGVSNFDVEDLEEGRAALTRHRIACNQVLYHLGERGIEHRVVPYCRAHRIAVVAYSPFGSGDFSSPSSRGGRVLAAIAKRRAATPRQVALAFLVREQPVFAIPKAASEAHVVENAGAGDLRLEKRDIAEIDAAFPLPKAGRPLAMI